MGTTHDTLALELQTGIMQEIKSSKSPWNSIFSPAVTLVNNTEWPLTDGIIKDDLKKIQCAIEFKPPGHDKREYLTGLGQSVAYLDKNEFSLYILPETSNDGFGIGEYVGNLVKSQLFDNIPLGVAVYDDQMNLKVIKEIPIIKRKVKNKAETSSTFWAFWREVSPHELFIILFEADRRYQSKTSIKHEVMDLLNTLRHDGKTRDPSGNHRAIGKKSGTESEAHTYRNTVPFLNALDLWDSFGHLTTKGHNLLRLGKMYGWKSSLFRDYLAKLVLLEGRHLQLMLLIDEYQYDLYKDQNLVSKNNDEFNNKIEDLLEDKGLLKRAPGRRTTSGRKRLQSELTLWSWLDLVEKHKGTYFIQSKGFKFKWERITELIEKNFL